VLSDARDAASRWLLVRCDAAPKKITLDVVVPTYRAPLGFLEKILSLDVPEEVSTQFTIVFDRPGNAEAQEVFSALERKHRANPYVRLRMNEENLGAGQSRNRGIRESAADWILFLDDDVVPNQDILCAYARAIRQHPNATGFVGLSRLPSPTNSRQLAVVLAQLSFFWTIAECFPNETELPWGVTANLCMRRANR